jgi:hypothetical protein
MNIVLHFCVINRLHNSDTLITALPHQLLYNRQTSISLLHQTAFPARPSLSPRSSVCTISTSDSVHHRLIRQRYTFATKQRARLRRMAYTTTSIRWILSRCVGASGSDQILNMSLIKSTPSLHRPERGAISFHLGVNFFPIQFYVGTRGLLT